MKAKNMGSSKIPGGVHALVGECPAGQVQPDVDHGGLKACHKSEAKFGGEPQFWSSSGKLWQTTSRYLLAPPSRLVSPSAFLSKSSRVQVRLQKPEHLFFWSTCLPWETASPLYSALPFRDSGAISRCCPFDDTTPLAFLLQYGLSSHLSCKCLDSKSAWF